MNTEIKLYLFTNLLDALYDSNEERIKEHLTELLSSKSLPADYFDRWMKRYETILISEKVQVTLLRQAGYTYRQIKDVVGMSPNTIQRILSTYDIDYTEMPDTVMIEEPLHRLETRLRKAGVELW